MKKLVYLNVVVLLLSLLKAAPLKADQGRGGGAGIAIDGSKQIATIGSLPDIKIKPLGANQIPGLAELQKKLGDLKVSQSIRNDLLVAAQPSIERRYYAVDEKYVSPDTIADIKTTYHDVLSRSGVPTKQQDIRVLALTVGNQTLLLPDFFTNMEDTIAQSTILFHESLWVRFPLDPDESYLSKLEKYRSVILTERAFEQWWRGTDEIKVYRDLGYLYQDVRFEVQSYGRQDLEQKIFSDVVGQDGMVPAAFILGDSLQLESSGEFYFVTDREKLKTHLLELIGRYPNSYLLAFLLKNVENVGVKIDTGYLSGDKKEMKKEGQWAQQCINSIQSLDMRLPLIANDQPFPEEGGNWFGWDGHLNTNVPRCRATLQVKDTGYFEYTAGYRLLDLSVMRP